MKCYQFKDSLIILHSKNSREQTLGLYWLVKKIEARIWKITLSFDLTSNIFVILASWINYRKFSKLRNMPISVFNRFRECGKQNDGAHPWLLSRDILTGGDV